MKPRRGDETFWGLLTWRGWWDVLGGAFETWGRRRWDLEGHRNKRLS